MFLAIIGFIITTILGMIVSIKEKKVLKHCVSLGNNLSDG